jgi:hypothetical protein
MVMATVELKEQVQVMEPALEDLNPTAVQQVAEILKEAEKPARAGQPKTAHWFYQVPCAGVRYYSY